MYCNKRIAGLLLSGVLMAAYPVQAQEAPVELMPAAHTGDAVDSASTQVESTDISVTPALDISLDTLGLYDEKSGGVDFEAWRGSNHARVKMLLENMPPVVPSPSVRQLVVRLLLSSTRPPESDTIRQQVFPERIAALWHLDEIAQTQRLLAMVPKNLRTADTARMVFTAHLLAGEIGTFCEGIGDALAEYGDNSGQWQRYSIYCLAREGDIAKAQLAIDVLAEQHVQLDAGFLALVDVMLGRSKEATSRFTAPLAMDDAAMLALAGVDAFPDNYVQDAPLPVLRLIQRQDKFSDALREEAQRRLTNAVALEKPQKLRATLRAWLRGEFAATREKPYDFAAKFSELQSNAGVKNAETGTTHRRYRFYTLLQALDFQRIMAEPQWRNAVDSETSMVRISPVLRAALANAVVEEWRGEAILLLAITAGQVPDLAVADDDSLADMVQALVQMGYLREAEALAAEAMAALY